MNFILVLLCLGAGFLLRRFEVIKDGGHLGLNAWLVYVAVPAAALFYVPKITWSADMLWPVLSPLLVFALAWLFIGPIAKLDAPTKGALLLGCGLANTSFVGFPLNLAYYGEPGLKLAVVCDQISFLLLSTVGVTVAIAHGEGERRRSMLASLLRFPPFLGFIVALAAPGWVSAGELPKLWEALAVTLVPVALFSVGMQIDPREANHDRRVIAWALGVKLLLTPAIIAGLFWLLGAKGLPAKVSVMEAAMASMATTSVLAVEYGLNARLVSVLIGIGVPLSLGTSYLWYLILERLFGAH